MNDTKTSDYSHHYRFRAETVVDALNLRKALYELEGFFRRSVRQITSGRLFYSSFKMAIVLPYSTPDIEILLWTPYSIEFVKRAMSTISDSHVMIETIREHGEYTGHREYDAENYELGIDLAEFWSLVQTTDDFFFRSVSMNSHNLQTHVLPYISSLREIQHILDMANNREFKEPVLRTIESGSVTVSAEGLGDAIRAIREFFSGRKHSANAELLEIQVERERIEAEREKLSLDQMKRQIQLENDAGMVQAEKKAKLDQARLDMEIKKEELRSRKLENEAKELEQLRGYFELATEFAAEYLPDDTTPEKRLDLIAQLVPPLRQISSSQLKLEIGRPDTLPEFPLSDEED